MLPNMCGGVQKLLPGLFFSMMNAAAAIDDDDGMAKYHSIRKSWQDQIKTSVLAQKHDCFTISNYGIQTFKVMEDEVFDYITTCIFEEVNMFELLKVETKCQCCGGKVQTKNHHLVCSQMSGLHKISHDQCVQVILSKFKSEYKARACNTVRRLTGEDSKRQPDIFEETQG